MIGIFGENYFIDIPKVNELCTYNSPDDKKELIINVPVYNTINMCIETLLSELPDEADNMALLLDNVSIPFKIAFNTLLENNILKKTDEDE